MSPTLTTIVSLPLTVEPPSLKNPVAWQKAIDSANTPYSRAIIVFAARWAKAMEAKIAAGASLEQIAEDSEKEADMEDICQNRHTYCWAVSLLASCWIHGDQLREWHNKQFGSYGTKASANSAVLIVSSFSKLE